MGRGHDAGSGREIGFPDLDTRDRAALTEMLSEGCNRRTALAFLAGLGLSTAVSGSIVAEASQALADRPKKGGRLVVAHSAHGPTDTLDPIRNKATIDYLRGRMIYGSLIRLSDALEPQPELAETFEANDTATEWTFRLRQDVEFHDGKTLTADDVVYSMNRHIGVSLE